MICLICMPSGLRPSGFGHTYQANHSCLCYNYYIWIRIMLLVINRLWAGTHTHTHTHREYFVLKLRTVRATHNYSSRHSHRISDKIKYKLLHTGKFWWWKLLANHTGTGYWQGKILQISYSQRICQIHFSNIGQVNNANLPIFPLPTVFDIRCVMYVGIDGYLGYKLFKDWGV